MKKIKETILIVLLLANLGTYVQSQNTNNQTSSPYSYYGLGNINDINTGKTNSLGRSGIAMPSNNSINNLNPASFGSIPLNSFLFDIGVRADKEALTANGFVEPRFNANFSNMAFAFPLSKKSALAITLIPFTNVGYILSGIESEIEGSNDTYVTDVEGSGGLNDIKINYGFSFSEKLRLGVYGSYLFGKIEEQEINYIGDNLLLIEEDNFYNGFRLGLGFQYDINKNISVGSIINFPTSLQGDQEKVVSTLSDTPSNSEETLNSFKFPLEFGFGAHIKLKEKLFFNIDYKRNFWEATNQSDYLGDYKNQDFFGAGVEYTPNADKFKFWQRVNYRLGFNLDNGNLLINDKNITNYAFNLGLGLPLNNKKSRINIGYTYGQKGEVLNGLVKENYHTLTINLSLEDLWFVKRKFN
ncbi:hypothetical protein [Pontimicrobium sp. IMCC45349]|uniref:hypothetical protein n=1 Tax=Pontimicrobium sp. IMCC45349 TaxID=3391574 RepID=UPI00399F74E7